MKIVIENPGFFWKEMKKGTKFGVKLEYALYFVDILIPENLYPSLNLVL